MIDAMHTILNAHKNELWKQYVSYEQQGLRHQALAVLEALIQSLLQDETAPRDAFLERFCTLIVDEQQRFPVRHPLFNQLLAPYLITQYQAGSPSAPRWIAGFIQQFHASPKHSEQLRVPYFSEYAMLQEALARDPANLAVQQKLVQVMVRQFDYCIHEVPSGVLFGVNGASIEECQELLEELRLFHQIAQGAGLLPAYQQQVAEWAYYFNTYADYLAHVGSYQSFAAYLRQHPQVEGR